MMECLTVSEVQPDSKLLKKLKQVYAQDEESKAIFESPDRHPRFKVLNQRIYWVDDDRLRLYVPSGSLRAAVMEELHDARCSGHLGIKRTSDLVKRDFYWPTLESDVEEFVKSCDACQCNKPSNQRSAGLLQPLEIPKNRWERVSMDLITHLPKTRTGYDALLVVVDYGTKMVVLRPTTGTATAVDVAKVFVDSVVRVHGLPRSIVSDRDSKFTSHFWKEVFRNMGTTLAMSSGFHPQTDGQTERANRTVEEIMRAYVGRRHNDWDKRLSMVEFVYNNAVHSSTGFTPFYLCYGRHPVNPANLLAGAETRNVAAEDWMETLSQDLLQAGENLQRAQERQKQYADKKRRPLELKSGDEVLLSTKYLNIAGVGPSHKFGPLYIGPFQVLECYPTAYKLELPEHIRVHPVFHVSQLKLYKAPKDERRRVQPPDAIQSTDGHEEYYVDEIVNHRVRTRGRQRIKEFLVFWEGYPAHEATWEPEDNLRNAQEKLAEYYGRIEDNA